jgi:hypothetical protein
MILNRNDFCKLSNKTSISKSKKDTANADTQRSASEEKSNLDLKKLANKSLKSM